MGRIILRKIKKFDDGNKVIKINGKQYTKLEELSQETGISMARLASVLVEEALKDVVVIDSDEENEEDT